MTVPTTIDAAGWLSKYLEGPDADGDMVRAMLKTFVDTLMSAEATAMCGAGFGERSDERVNSRNGYRDREWDTRTGTVELAIPKLRQGSYFPDWLLVPRRRAEQALVAVICQAYVEGVSTRRLDDLVKAMGIEGISRSQVSRMAVDLDAKVAEFRHRPLDDGPYRYLWIDALTQKVREGGRVVNVSVVIATAVNAEGRREIIGFDIFTAETTDAWTEFLRGLVERGLSGVELVISDAHGGIKAAIAAVLGGASWQRCRTHFMANLASRVSKGDWPMVATLVRSIFEQPDRDATWDQLGVVVDKLTEAGFIDQAMFVLDAADDILAFSAFPVEHWPKIRSNNPQERLNKEIRRRTDVVGIFPNRAAVIRLVGALLAEQSDEWAITKRYMGSESLKTARIDNRSEHDPRPAMAVTAG
ncbi:MAG: IS256 family transposase [Actinomycetota bacterium]|nr:IS256 family transposase [Actinomycetota bacterium]